MFLSDQVKIVKVQDHTTAGTNPITSDGVDCSGYDGVMFLTSFGTAAANNTIEVAVSSDNSSFSDLTGTNVTSGTSDEDVFVDIWNPALRYAQCQVARGTSTTCESIWAFLYGAKALPVDNTTSGTIAGEQHVAPVTGTA